MTVYLLLISDGLPRAAQQRRRQGRLAVNDGRAHSWQQSRRQDVDVDVDGFKLHHTEEWTGLFTIFTLRKTKIL